MTERPITVSITTRNRPAAVARCVRSLASIGDLIARVVIVDDASAPALPAEPLTAIAAAAGISLDIVRAETHIGTAAGKNLIAQRTRAPYLLSLDDDAFLIEGEAVRRGLDVLQRDSQIAAVAFAQCDETGRKWPPAQQPAGSNVACYVPAFIGFACLIATARLLEAGGYREAFIIHGEERELCLRWLDRGLHVVYLPDALVAHVAEAANRDLRTYVRYVMRNDCLAALYNEPLPRAVCIVPYKLWSYTRMRAGIEGGDAGGLAWIVRELGRHAREILRDRRPVSWRTVREWRRLREATPPYPGSGLAA